MPHATVDWKGPSGIAYQVEVEFGVENDIGYGEDADGNRGIQFGEHKSWPMDGQCDFEPPIETEEDQEAATNAEDELVERAFEEWINNL